MSFLKKIFTKKEAPVQSYADFWQWFQQHAQTFFNVVKNRSDIEKGFFDKLTPKLEELKDGFFFVTGMCDDNTAELILTAEGNTSNIVFTEELVAAAPVIPGWKFTALKPALDIKDVSIEMAGYRFNESKLSFYDNEPAAYPDEVDITVVHEDYTEENKIAISNGVYIFLDNYLGELDFVNNIDQLTITGKEAATKELIPISKLKDFLTWRQKEFIEKYEAVSYDTSTDDYALLEATLENGNPLLAIVSNGLLQWDYKASHPWVAVINFKYDGSKKNGMPGNDDYQLLNEIEETMLAGLKDVDGYLNIGRQTADGEKAVYFACRDFRKPSKVFYDTQQKNAKRFKISYEIYKDKYWQSFERFIPQPE